MLRKNLPRLYARRLHLAPAAWLPDSCTRREEDAALPAGPPPEPAAAWARQASQCLLRPGLSTSPAALQPFYRGFCTNGTTPAPPFSAQEAQTVLQRLDAAHFREVLEQEAESRWNIEHGELVRLCIASGAATTEQDAAEIIEALDRSGVVLRVKGLVYLRPLEVAEIIYHALPDTDREVRARLEQLQREIQPLAERKAAIDTHAHRVSKRVLWGGLALMVGQWALFFRLTFWELSWDVMEPLTYFTGAAVAIACFAYCLWFNEEFGYVRARERIHSSVADKVYEREGFDKGRFDYLRRRIHRLESSLTVAGLAAATKR